MGVCGSMALFSGLFSRQLSFSGSHTGSLKCVLGSFQCRCEDEVFLEGGLTGGNVPAFACKFAKNGLHGNLLAIADEEGSVRLMDTRKPASKSFIKEIGAHKNAIFDIAWLPGDSQLLTASGDTKMGLWDVVGGTRLSVFGGHTSSVKSVDVKSDDLNVFISGSRDGNICMWDTRCAKKGSQHRPVNTITMAHKVVGPTSSNKRKGRGRSEKTTPASDVKQSVTSVCFHGDNKIASVGTADGIVKLWDMRRNYSSCRKEPPLAWHTFTPVGEAGRHSFTSLISDPFNSLLFASSTDNIVYMYSSTTLNKLPVGAFSGHKISSFYVKTSISPDGRYLLSGSSCGNAFIWEVNDYEAPPLVLVGHVTEVTAVDWCPTQFDKVVTCSDGNDVRVWRVAQRKGNSLLGEYIGSCEEYSGQDHLKAKQMLQMYREQQSNKEREAVRIPLNLVATNSKKSPSNIAEQTPKLQHFTSHSTPRYSFSKNSTVGSVRQETRDAKTVQALDLACAEHTESETTIVNVSHKHSMTTHTTSDKDKQQPVSYHQSSPPSATLSRQAETNSPLNLDPHNHLSHSTTTIFPTPDLLEMTNDCSTIVTKVEITPERSSLHCESRKRKLLFEPCNKLIDKDAVSSCSSRPEGGSSNRDNDGPSKKRRTRPLPASDKSRSRLKEKVGGPSPSSTRHCRRQNGKRVQNKTPQRDSKQTSVQLYFKPNTK